MSALCIIVVHCWHLAHCGCSTPCVYVCKPLINHVALRAGESRVRSVTSYRHSYWRVTHATCCQPANLCASGAAGLACIVCVPASLRWLIARPAEVESLMVVPFTAAPVLVAFTQRAAWAAAAAADMPKSCKAAGQHSGLPRIYQTAIAATPICHMVGEQAGQHHVCGWVVVVGGLVFRTCV